MKIIALFCMSTLLSFVGSAQISGVDGWNEQVRMGEIKSAESNLFLHLNTDCWPEENTWLIKNLQGDIIHQGGPYFNQSLTEITEDFWLESGVYTFTFYDAAGDGLYATQWGGLCDENGSFELVDAGENVLLEDDGSTNFDSLSVTFEFNAAVGISEFLPIQSIRTYPNPFFNRLWLELELQQSERFVIEVFSLDGRLQYRHKATQLSAGTNYLQLAIEHLGAGQYILRISGGSKTETQHIVKLK